MKQNVANQFVGTMMTYAASGTPVVTSGAVTVYVRASSLAMQLGAVGGGVCVPNSYGLHHYVAAASETNFEWIAFTFVASGAVNVTNQLYTEFPQTGDSFARIGAPVGASVSVDVSSIQVGVNSLYARVGAPVGASLAVDVSSVQTGVNSIYGRIGATGSGLTTLAASGDLAVANTNITSLHTRVGSVQTGTDNIFSRIGAPVGASLAVDVKSIQTQVDSIYGRIGENGINITSASVAVGAVTVSEINSSALVRFFNRASGLLYSDAVSGSVVKEIGYTAINSSVQANSIQIGVNSLYARVGAPVGASLVADVGSVQTGVNSLLTSASSLHTRVSSVQVGADNIFTRIGVPVGADLVTDVKSVQSGVNSTMARIGENGINITSASVSVGGATVTDISSAALALFFTRDSGKLYTADAVSGSVVKEIGYTVINSSVQANSVQIGVNSLYARVGAPTGASIAADVSSVQTGVNSLLTSAGSLHTRVSSVQSGADSIFTRIGAPIGASISVDISSVQTGVNSAAVQVNSNAVAVSSLHTRVASVQTGTDNVFTRVGAPAGASVSVDISSIAAQVSSNAVAVGSLHTRVASAATQVGSVYASTVNLPSDPADESLIIAATDAIMTRIGVPVGANLVTDVGSIQTGVNSIVTTIASLHTRVSSVQTGADNIFTRIGAPVGVSLVVDVGSVQAGVNSLQPLTTNVASVQTGVNSLLTSAGSLHTRVSSVQTGADNIFTRIGAPVGASLVVDVSSVQTGVTSLTAGVDVTRVGSDANAVTNLRRGVLGVVIGATTGDSTTDTLSTASLTPAAGVAQQWVGKILTFDRDTVTAGLRGQATVVNSMTAGGVMYVSSLTTAPASGNTFAIT